MSTFATEKTGIKKVYKSQEAEDEAGYAAERSKILQLENPIAVVVPRDDRHNLRIRMPRSAAG
jgi:hypothetical protein